MGSSGRATAPGPGGSRIRSSGVCSSSLSSPPSPPPHHRHTVIPTITSATTATITTTIAHIITTVITTTITIITSHSVALCSSTVSQHLEICTCLSAMQRFFLIASFLGTAAAQCTDVEICVRHR